MQNITQSWFVQGMIKATTDAWLKGWDERNGGNLTLRLDDADIAPYKDNFHAQPRYIPLSQPMPLLANTPFIVTGSGKFFRNVQLDPAANLGVVKVDSDGAGYHILWGLTNEAVPTSELPAHFLSHCERIKATNGKDRVIMHCHATNLIALTYVLENDRGLYSPTVGRQHRVSGSVPGWRWHFAVDGAPHGRNRPGDRTRDAKTFAGVVALPRRLRQRVDVG